MKPGSKSRAHVPRKLIYIRVIAMFQKTCPFVLVPERDPRASVRTIFYSTAPTPSNAQEILILYRHIFTDITVDGTPYLTWGAPLPSSKPNHQVCHWTRIPLHYTRIAIHYNTRRTQHASEEVTICTHICGTPGVSY